MKRLSVLCLLFLGLVAIGNSERLRVLPLKNGMAQIPRKLTVQDQEEGQGQEQEKETSKTVSSYDDKMFSAEVNLGPDYLSQISSSDPSNHFYMSIMISSSETIFSNGCSKFSFAQYDCKAPLCAEDVGSDTPLQLPFLSVDKATRLTFTFENSASAASITNGSWELTKQPLLMHDCSKPTDDLRRETYLSSTSYGLLGLGTEGSASSNFKTENPIFSTHLNYSKKTGDLIFGFDENRAKSSTPIIALNSDENWRVPIASIQYEDFTYQPDTPMTLIFEMQAEQLHLPPTAYDGLRSKWQAMEGIESCTNPTDECLYPSHDLETVPGIIFTLADGTKFSVDAYHMWDGKEKHEALSQSSGSKTFWRQRVGTINTKNSDSEYIVLGYRAMSQFYALFQKDMTANTNTVTLYSAVPQIKGATYAPPTPITEPPVTEPPVTEPPVTEPPVTEPPVTEPPVTEPPKPDHPDTHYPYTSTVSSLENRMAVETYFGYDFTVTQDKNPENYTYPMAIMISTSETAFAHTGGLFSTYYCTKPLCVLDGERTNIAIDLPFITVENATRLNFAFFNSVSAATIVNGSWELKTSPLYFSSYKQPKSFSADIKPDSSYPKYNNNLGWIGLGTEGEAASNFKDANPTFSFHLNRTQGTGDLIFGFDETRTQSKTPITTLKTDENWRMKVSSIKYGDYIYNSSGKAMTLIFDVQVEGLHVPTPAFAELMNRWTTIDGMHDCRPDDTTAQCYFSAKNLSIIPDITFTLADNTSFTIDAYHSWGNSEDKIIDSETGSGTNWYKKVGPVSYSDSDSEYIVLGYRAMSQFYSLFKRDSTAKTNTVTFYTPVPQFKDANYTAPAPTPDTPSTDPKPDTPNTDPTPDASGDGWTTYLIYGGILAAIIIAFVVVASCCCKNERPPPAKKTLTVELRGADKSTESSVASSVRL